MDLNLRDRTALITGASKGIGRGSAESRRGLALSLAFGVGPLLAVLGSFGQTALLGGELFDIKFPGVGYPDGFITLFGVGAPIVALAAGVSRFFVVPPVVQEPRREPLSAVTGLLVGLPMMFAAVALVHLAAVTNQEGFRYLGYLAGAGATATRPPSCGPTEGLPGRSGWTNWWTMEGRGWIGARPYPSSGGLRTR
jgi:hypothetical protein